jgi:hypothetical protein
MPAGSKNAKRPPVAEENALVENDSTQTDDPSAENVAKASSNPRSREGRVSSQNNNQWLDISARAVMAVVALLVCGFILKESVEFLKDQGNDFEVPLPPWAKTSDWLQQLSTTMTVDPTWLRQITYNATSAYHRQPDRVGLKLAKQGLRAKYPVVLIPGFVTSGLELWSGHDCFKGEASPSSPLFRAFTCNFV